MTADIGFTDANTFSMGAYHHGTKAHCPKYGVIGGDFRCFATEDPEYTTEKICPKCFVDFIAANVQKVERIPPTTQPSAE